MEEMAFDPSHCRTGQDCGCPKLLLAYPEEAQTAWNTSWKRETRLNQIFPPKIMIMASSQNLQPTLGGKDKGAGEEIIWNWLSLNSELNTRNQERFGEKIHTCAWAHTCLLQHDRGSKKENTEERESLWMTKNFAWTFSCER